MEQEASLAVASIAILSLSLNRARWRANVSINGEELQVLCVVKLEAVMLSGPIHSAASLTTAFIYSG